MAVNIGDLPLAASIRAVSQAAGTVNGVAVDAQYALEVLWIVDVGAATGAPTSLTVDVKVQDADDSAFTQSAGDAKDEANANIAIVQLTAGSTLVKLPDRLHGNAATRPSKRFRRAVAIVAFVGGATPAIPVAVHAVLVKRFMP